MLVKSPLCEELNRYYKRVNAYTKPTIGSIFPADKEVESQDAESDRPTNQMFIESVDESDNDWTDVTVPDQVPTVARKRYVSGQHRTNSYVIGEC